jgi:hypothetical protein
LLRQRKALPQVITAIARELLGFVWAIGVVVEQTARPVEVAGANPRRLVGARCRRPAPL